MGVPHFLKEFLVAQMVKNRPTLQGTWVQSLGRKGPWRRKWQFTTVFLPGEFNGQMSLSGYIQSMRSQRVGHDWATNTFTFTPASWYQNLSQLLRNTIIWVVQTTEIYFSQIWKSEIRVPPWSMYGENSFWLAGSCLLPLPSYVKGRNQTLVSLPIRVLIPSH